MKACREKRGTAPLTLNLDVRWKWAVNSQIEVSGQQLDGSERSTVRWKWAVKTKPLPLYPYKEPWYEPYRKTGGPRSRYGLWLGFEFVQPVATAVLIWLLHLDHQLFLRPQPVPHREQSFSVTQTYGDDLSEMCADFYVQWSLFLSESK